MDKSLKSAKSEIRPYLRSISDQSLWQLCAMAKDGEIRFVDACKCIRGIVGGGTIMGYESECGDLAMDAERGLNRIGHVGLCPMPIMQAQQDPHRNSRLLPMVKAEMRRRDSVWNEQTDGGQGPGEVSLRKMLRR